ncbi:MAG: P83/100 family protein, partial [Spirochaetia bacterium]
TDSQIKEKEADIKNREADIKQREQDIARREEEIKKKQENVKKTREDIVTDERSLPPENKSTDRQASTNTAPDTGTGKALFLKIADGAEDSKGELVLLDFKTNSLMARSDSLNIKERKFYVFADGILVVASPGAGGENYLLLLDPLSLKETIRSKEQVFGRAIVIISGNNIYTVVKMGNSYYIGKFDRNLKLLNASQEEVNPLTPLVLSGRSLYAQSKRGRALQLSPTDLSLQNSASLP